MNFLTEADDQDQLSDVLYPVRRESRTDLEGIYMVFSFINKPACFFPVMQTFELSFIFVADNSYIVNDRASQIGKILERKKNLVNILTDLQLS